MELEMIVARWRAVRAGLIEALDRFQDDDIRFIPFVDSWPTGEIMLHIAGAEEGWFRHVVTQELAEWPADITLERYPTVQAIKEVLSEVHHHTEDFLSSLDDAALARPVTTPWGKELSLGWIIWHVLEHEIHHRGELSLILGMLGRTGLDV